MPRPEYPADHYHSPCQHEGDFTVLNSAILEIKDAIRDLKDLLTSNAVLEEQAVVTRSTLAQHDERLRKVEMEQAQMTGSGKWIEKAVWAAVAAGMTYLLTGKLQI